MKVIITIAVILILIILFSDKFIRYIKVIYKPDNTFKPDISPSDLTEEDSVIMKSSIRYVQLVSDTSHTDQLENKEFTFVETSEEWEDIDIEEPEIDMDTEADEYSFPPDAFLASGVEFENINKVFNSVEKNEISTEIIQIVNENITSDWLQKVIESNKKAGEYVSGLLNSRLSELEIQENEVDTVEQSSGNFDISHYL